MCLQYVRVRLADTHSHNVDRFIWWFVISRRFQIYNVRIFVFVSHFFFVFVHPGSALPSFLAYIYECQSRSSKIHTLVTISYQKQRKFKIEYNVVCFILPCPIILSVDFFLCSIRLFFLLLGWYRHSIIGLGEWEGFICACVIVSKKST